MLATEDHNIQVSSAHLTISVVVYAGRNGRKMGKQE